MVKALKISMVNSQTIEKSWSKFWHAITAVTTESMAVTPLYSTEYVPSCIQSTVPFSLASVPGLPCFSSNMRYSNRLTAMWRRAAKDERLVSAQCFSGCLSNYVPDTLPILRTYTAHVLIYFSIQTAQCKKLELKLHCFTHDLWYEWSSRRTVQLVVR